MKKLNQLFENLFNDYQQLNPSVKKIHSLFMDLDESIINDHVAFRTINSPVINMYDLAAPFIEMGYSICGHYKFEEKRLDAIHLEHQEEILSPKVFISQLRTEDFSPYLQQEMQAFHTAIMASKPDVEQLLTLGNPWYSPVFDSYEKLRNESEYAAWLYVFGFRANHFTILVNHLEKFTNLLEVNDFLKSKGFQMNTSGGEIKGSPALLLEQSSTLADQVDVQFKEGTYTIPACYYEFAYRYTKADNKLYQGFIANSADKIFESTNYRK